MKDSMKAILKALLYLIFGYVGAMLLIMGAACLLWNYLIPSLFNGPHLTLWQTILIYVLLNLLRHDWTAEYARSFQEKFNEEKEKLKNNTI